MRVRWVEGGVNLTDRTHPPLETEMRPLTASHLLRPSSSSSTSTYLVHSLHEGVAAGRQVLALGGRNVQLLEAEAEAEGAGQGRGRQGGECGWVGERPLLTAYRASTTYMTVMWVS